MLLNVLEANLQNRWMDRMGEKETSRHQQPISAVPEEVHHRPFVGRQLRS